MMERREKTSIDTSVDAARKSARATLLCGIDVGAVKG
jgi:hypothetical protein